MASFGALLPLADGGVLTSPALTGRGAGAKGPLVRIGANGEIINSSFGVGSPFSLSGQGVQLRDGSVLVVGSNGMIGSFVPTNLNVTYNAVSDPIGVSPSGVVVTLARIGLDGIVDAARSIDINGLGTVSVSGLWRMSDDRILIAGLFDQVGDHVTHDLAILKADGAVDTTFTCTTPFAGGIFAFAPDGTVVGLGDPSVYSEHRLIRYNLTSGIVETWMYPLDVASTSLAVGADNRPLLAVKPSNTSVLTSALDLYVFSPGAGAGTLLRSFAWSSQMPRITQMFPQSDGKTVLVGSLPVEYTGQPVGALRIQPDGATDVSFIPSHSQETITFLAPIAGGWFVASTQTLFRNFSKGWLRRLDSSFATDLSFNCILGDVAVPQKLFTLSDGSLLAAGYFQSPEGKARRFVKITPDGALDFSAVPQIDEAADIEVGRISTDGYIYLKHAEPRTILIAQTDGGSSANPENGLFHANEFERYTLNGVRDEAFGRPLVGNGIITALATDADHRIVAAWSSGTGDAMVSHLTRFSAAGTNDSTFVFDPAATDLRQIDSIEPLPERNGYVAAGTSQVLAVDERGGLLQTASGITVKYNVDYNAVRNLVTLSGRVFALGYIQSILAVHSVGMVRLKSTGLADVEWQSGLPTQSAINNAHLLPDGRWLLEGGGIGWDSGFVIVTPDGLIDRNESLPAVQQVGVVADGRLYLFAADGALTRMVRVARPDVSILRTQVDDHHVRLQASVASGAQGTFQWFRNNLEVTGAASEVLDVTLEGGVYSVRFISDQGTAWASARALPEKLYARLLNASARSFVGQGEAAQIVGFVAEGMSDQPTLARSVRSTLTSFGVAHPTASKTWDAYVNGRQMYVPAIFLPFFPDVPVFPKYQGSEILQNALFESGAFPLADTENNFQYLMAPVSRQPYSFVASASGADAGIALSEFYFPQDPDPRVVGRRLLNFSCRALAGEGENVMIMGFVIEGNRDLPVLIRGIGPRLKDFGVTRAAADTTLELFSKDGSVTFNDDWHEQPNAADVAAAAARVGAFSLPDESRDAATLVSLSPGVYSVVVRSKSGTNAEIAMIELYDASQ